MSKKEKSGGAVLLEKKHFKKKNPWGKPVVGWQKASQGSRGLVNPMGWACMWIVLTKKDENGKDIVLYEQPVIFENPGSIVIVRAGNKIGLMQNFRMLAERFYSEEGAGYIKRVDSEKKWKELVATLGEWTWECPRGLIPPMEKDDKNQSLKDFIIKTAKMEALQEAGLKISNAEIKGKVNANTTFFPHSQYVVLADLESVTKSAPENLEIIGATKFFTLEELKKMNMDGEFIDGLTLAALALCGMSI